MNIQNLPYAKSFQSTLPIVRKDKEASSAMPKEEKSTSKKISSSINLNTGAGTLDFLSYYEKNHASIKSGARLENLAEDGTYGEVVQFARIIKKFEPEHCLIFPLFNAAKRGHLEMVKFFIEECGEDPHRIVNEGPVLKHAVASGNLELIKYLIETCKVEVEARGAAAGVQDTALCVAARAGFYAIAIYLIQKGANVNANGTYYPVLTHAAMSGRCSIVKALVEKGAKVNDSYDGTSSALHYALEKGDFESVRYLLGNGCDIRKDYLRPSVISAAKSGNFDLFKYLVEELQLEVCPPHNYNDPSLQILEAAARGGSTSIIRFLVVHPKVDLGILQKKENLRSFIKAADESGNVDLLQYLFEDLLPEKKLLPSRQILEEMFGEEYYLGNKKTPEAYAYLLSHIIEDARDKELMRSIYQKGLISHDPSTLKKLFKGEIKQWKIRNYAIAAIRRQQIVSEYLKEPLLMSLEQRVPIEIAIEILSFVDFSTFVPKKSFGNYQGFLNRYLIKPKVSINTKT